METDEIIRLVNLGVDFGAMTEIRTLIDEIKRLRPVVNAAIAWEYCGQNEGHYLRGELSEAIRKYTITS